LEPIVAGLKNHWWIDRFSFFGVELDGDLAARICPMSKGGDCAFACILSYGSRTVRSQADAERGAGGPAGIRRIRRFGAVDAGIS
jgi:hypothetical protein